MEVKRSFFVPVNIISHVILHIEKVQSPHRIRPKYRYQTSWFLARIQSDLKVTVSEHLRSTHHPPLRNGVSFQLQQCVNEILDAQFLHERKY